MKPRLKAAKGYRWRVIVCDAEGNYEWDDFLNRDSVGFRAERCIRLLLKRERYEKSED